MNKSSDTLKVYIIEDNQQIRDGLAKMLSKAGYQVSSAQTHGDAALELKSVDFCPDVILLDDFTGSHKRDRRQPGNFSAEAFLVNRSDKRIPCVAIGATDKVNDALINVKGRGPAAVGKIGKDKIQQAIKFEPQGVGETSNEILLAVADAIGKGQSKGAGRF